MTHFDRQRHFVARVVARASMSSSIGSRALAAAALATSRRFRPAARLARPAALPSASSSPQHARHATVPFSTTGASSSSLLDDPASASAASSSSSECTRIRPGDRGLPIVYHPAYSKPTLPPGHRFPMPVFREIYRRLLRDGVAVPGANIFRPARFPSREELEAAHDPAYVDAFCSGALDERAMRGIGFPWSEALVERTLAEVAGTMLTADLALQCGVAAHVAGGTHHARRARGSGFCILNDLAVTAKRVLDQGRVDRVLIVDLDVHQGDGTASILADDPRAFTLSVHCAENFPRVKETGGDRDVALPAGTGDDAYVAAVNAALRESLEAHDPQLVLYDAGVDVHESDALGGLRLTDEGLIRREATVLDTCVGRGVPIAAVVGGGYDADLDALARRHCILHHVAREIFESNGVA